MPIRPEFRHLYGREWREVVRPRILKRAKNKCERCRKPNGARIITSTCRVEFAGIKMFWRILHATYWRDDGGRYCRLGPYGSCLTPAHEVRVVLTVAHLNHVAGDDRDENLKALCQWCHLNYDLGHHHETRATRKDAARPLLNPTPTKEATL